MGFLILKINQLSLQFLYMAEEVNTQNQGEVAPESFNPVQDKPAAVIEPPLESVPISDVVQNPAPDLNSDSSPSSEIQISPEIKTETIQPEASIESPVEFKQEQYSWPMPPSSSHMKELWLKFREKVIERKSKKLEKIMSLAVKKRQITNDDVQKLLNISDATATRYLKELVRQGRLRQSIAGRGSFYELI
ncbi:MAG: hypothetical protein A3J46_06775 [Candidatus Yanofskybacteria bacterium RIFCSPHIGHO2_02_FULL_41_11]|uniref:Uncharacterized protein n=1 Tax=Candidatus Yanofskybacteria bacterium RIFCSPHIGHO2_02_FULL_41_11 TaxID=1802675 RepID=A0A1F8F5H4_9BACT|nr:MAG: hypothetical protein A3J46_06775 [Candidatus Yanofskybacteria bacterium RIFCSPHIGHO2_02_FULL_41_11]